MKKNSLSATPVERGAGEIAITTAFSGYFVSAIFHALLGLSLQDIGNFDMSFINVTFK